MDMERIYQGVVNKRENDEISIGSQDSYSQRNLGLETDVYQEDSFLEMKKENLKEGKIYVGIVAGKLLIIIKTSS